MIKSNKRITYLRDLESARNLKAYIDTLDEKYNVDSTDPDNTFGRVNLDNPIIKSGVSNTLYFAGISSYTNDPKLPKHEAIPHDAPHIIIDGDGNVGMAHSYAHLSAERKPITIDNRDIEELLRLRQEFKVEVEQNAPAHPDMSKEVLGEGFDELTKPQQSKRYDEILKQQGYATDQSNHITFSTMVPDQDGNENEFEVEYYRLGNNKLPHFTTNYNGWQNQEDMSHTHPAYKFYKKWNIFHLNVLTREEWFEMVKDLKKLGDF